MKLMRIADETCVELIDLPDRVSTLVDPGRGAVIDPATGNVITPAVEAVYGDRPAVPSDFYHPDAGFVDWDGKAELGQIRVGEAWETPAPAIVTDRPRMATPNALVTALTSAEYAAALALRPRDLARIETRAGDMIPETNPVLERIASAVGLTVGSLIDRLAP